MKTQYDYMFFPGATRNALHQILLASHPRITRVVILDYKNFTALPPHTVQIFVYVQWLEETKADRVAFLLELKELITDKVGANMQFGLDLVEDFEYATGG